jgi:hypothetical protein
LKTVIDEDPHVSDIDNAREWPVSLPQPLSIASNVVEHRFPLFQYWASVHVLPTFS